MTDAPSATDPAAPRANVRAARTGVASGSKVAAAGLGFATMLGLVAAMGVAGRSSAAAPPPAAPLPAAPDHVVVVIHPADATAGQGGAPTAAGSAPASSQPIVLSPQPTVRQAPASPAPTARTNGSR
jgi:hypothetical protein